MLSPAEAVNAIKSGEITEFVFMSVIGGTFDKPALIMAPAEEVQRVPRAPAGHLGCVQRHTPQRRGRG